MLVITIFLICIAILVGFYFYKYLRRSFLCFGADVTQKKIKTILITASALIGFSCANIGGTAALWFLHVLFISLFMRFLNFVAKIIFNSAYINGFKYWKKTFQSGIVPVVLSCVILVLGYFNMHNVVKTQYTVYTDKQIRPQGYTVALIADVHFGVSLSVEELNEKCKEISRQNPDIVILAGDITDSGTTKEGMEDVFEALGKIDNNFGIFYIYGNHDRTMHMMENEYSDKELAEAIEKNGITILKDEVVRINNEICLIGRDDLITERMGEGRLLLETLAGKTIDSDYIITLDHQPNDYKENGRLGINLVLSGHTHGGQIWPADLIQKIFGINDAVYGHTAITKSTDAIVTSGFAGWSYPIKTSAPAEYVIINIQRAK